MVTALKNMHIQYTKININRDMASFARYEMVLKFRLRLYTYPLSIRGAQKNLNCSKTLHFNTRHQQLYP